MNTMKKINGFRDERDWRQFYNEKDLAISLEASDYWNYFSGKIQKK